MSEKYTFTIEKRGYNTDEVDSALDDLNSKNKYLTSRVAELEQKLDTARRLIRRFSDSENGLRQNIADSKRAAADMLNDAKDRSDTLLDKARESCGDIISDLDMKIADRMNTVDVIRAEVASFKDQLFALYSSHIDLIESVAATAENFVYEPDYSPVAEAVEKFEEAKAPEVELPEFAEYPQESIFADFEREEEDEEFKIESPVEEEVAAPEEQEFEKPAEETVKAAAEEEIVFDDLSDEPQIPFDEESFTDITDEDITSDAFEYLPESDEAEESAEGGDEAASDEPDFEEIPEETEFPLDEVPSEGAPAGDLSDDEYYQFLENFINEDDGSLSDPD